MTDEVSEPYGEALSAEIRAELHRVLASPQFEASERNRRFLTYVIEEAFAGRAGRIKAYNIATDVFGRDASFDPQLDPVVRMEARRLRRSLERFYLIDGQPSRIRIAMPKGGYVPEFEAVETVAAAEAAPASPTDYRRGTSIAVAGFDAEGDESVFSHFSQGFTDQVIVGLSKYPELSVFGPAVALRSARAADHAASPQDMAADFVLAGSTALFENILNVKAMLVHAGTGRVLWGQTFERRPRPGMMLRLRDEIADTIVRAVAEPHGVIFNHRAGAAETSASGARGMLDTVARFDRYRRSYRRDLFHQLRLALEQEIVVNPEDCDAIACLSHICSDAHRFGFAGSETPFALKRRAAELARQAVELDPASARAYHALGLAHWFQNDVPASVTALQTAVALNQESPEIVADLGLVWSLRGEWSRAVPLLEEARGRKEPQGTACRSGLSIYHFAGGRFDDALADAVEIDAPDVAHGFVIRAISQIRLGRRSEAEESVGRTMALAQHRARGGLAELGGRNVHAELAGSVAAALRDAGLPQEFIQA
jgi:adenylate cyclase